MGSNKIHDSDAQYEWEKDAFKNSTSDQSLLTISYLFVPISLSVNERKLCGILMKLQCSFCL